MDLLTTRKHPTPSQRLLQNLLDNEKSHIDALLQTQARSRSSLAALSAYASSGRDQPLGLAVGGVVGSMGEEAEAPMEAYASTLTQTRLALKEIRDAEEVLANITRDRDILVARMIKQTKKKPSKSELRKNVNENGSSHNHMLARHDSGSTPTSPSVSSFTANKLDDAQAELAGCETTLRKEENNVEEVRRRVIRDILEDRLRSISAMGKGLDSAAQKGLVELHQYLSEGAPYDDLHNVPRNINKKYTPSVDSNTPSLAPSQSASQVARSDNGSSSGEDEPHHSRYSQNAQPTSRQRTASAASSIRAGSQAGGRRGLASVIESSGGSSEDEVSSQNLQVVENRPRGRAASDTGGSSPLQGRKRAGPASPSSPTQASGSIARRLAAPKLGLSPPPAPSSTWNTSSPLAQNHDSDSESDSGTLRAEKKGGGRKAQSDLGMSRPGVSKKASLARRGSSSSFGAGGSDKGSIRKKKGFFASFKSLFGGGSSKGSQAGSVRARSPDSMRRSNGAGGWQTRTDKNLRRGGTVVGRGGRATDNGDSSDEDDRRRPGGGLVAVTNLSRVSGKKGAVAGAGEAQWSVEDVGKEKRPPVKRNPSSSGTLKAAGKQSPSAPSSSLSKSVSSATLKAPSASSNVASTAVSRSSTVKSTKAASSISKSKTSAGTDAAPSGPVILNKPPGVVSSKRAAVTKAKTTSPVKETGPPSIPTLVEIKAPKSSNPAAGLFTVRAPGTSLVPASLSVPILSVPLPPSQKATPAHSTANGVKRSNSFDAHAPSKSDDVIAPPKKASSNAGSNSSNQPAHRSSIQPPRSAMKQLKSPSGTSSNASSPSGTILGTVKAPGSVLAPPPTASLERAASPARETDTESIYETGVEDNDGDDDDGYATDRAPTKAVDSMLPGYNGPALGGAINGHADASKAVTVDHLRSPETLAPLDGEQTLSRRKSVRMDVPDSPAVELNASPLSSPSRRSSVKASPRPISTVLSPPAVTATPSYEPSYEAGSWSSRIGTRPAADSSDEDENEGEYASARRAMARAEARAERKGAKTVDKGKGRAFCLA